MAFVTIPEFCWPEIPSNPSGAPNISGLSTFDIASSTEWVAWVGQVPETVTLDRWFFRVASATTGFTAAVRVETVDTATGVPTGTLVNANASATVSVGTGAADYTGNFTGTFSVTKGDLIAFVISVSSGSPAAVLFPIMEDVGTNTGFPYLLDFDASANLRLAATCGGLGISGAGALALEKLWPINAAGNTVYSSGSTPDTVGNRITVDQPIRVSGFWVWLDQDATATVKLYNTDGSTVLASKTLDINVPPSASQLVSKFRFSSSVELQPGDYFLAVEATSGSNISLAEVTFVSSTWRSGSPLGGDKLTYAACTQTPANVASWTVTETKQAFIGLLIDGIESGGGGGQTAHVFMA